MLVRCGKEGGGKGALVQDDVSATLSTSNTQTLFQPAPSSEAGNAERRGLAVFENHPQDSRIKGPLEVAPTIHAKYGTGGGNVPRVAGVPAGQGGVVCMASGQANAEVEHDMAPSQAARQYKDPQIVCMADDNAKASVDFDMCGSLKVGGSAPIAACTTQYGSELAGTLTARADSSPCHDKGANVVSDDYVVRRLMPLECERLQGFPDGWTKVSYRGKSAEDCPDAPRYKALGNTMAVPVMRWIGERILRAERLVKGESQNPSRWEAS